MTVEIWVAAIACVGSLGAAGFSARSANRSTKVEESKVDAEAYQRAKAVYESALDTMEEQLKQVRERLDVVTNQLTQEQDASIALRRQVRDLQTQLAAMEQTVADLRIQLSKAGIQMPGHASPSSDQTGSKQ
ncbi:hypothetical protein [Microbispora triticiradicis]|uniref:hypothetical protein n=1 Tax=Microbispora triticiradicis TaxID=2200763 RepID=UPI001AD69454|nr:hypothetical protein [Microbispora triticiradicis]MBO4272373.1 hypothetical protein [Microbispora triticiradicis]